MKNTGLSEQVASLHTQFAVIKELTDVICELDEKVPQEHKEYRTGDAVTKEAMLLHVLKKMLEKKFAELEKSIDSVKQGVDAEISEMQSELEKFKNA